VFPLLLPACDDGIGVGSEEEGGALFTFEVNL
jgi:hypothetical protein